LIRGTLITRRSSNDIIKPQQQNYLQQFTEETAALITEQNYTVIEAAEPFGVRPNIISNQIKQC
jgi:hypothetical protein